jgi:tRNA threonylcarbamoyladenosine biosynthesis protein TsaE
MDRRLCLSIEMPEDMVSLGRCAGEAFFDGAVIGLSGALGAGKTTLARGIAEGMGIDEDYVVSSPTYTIMQTYPCRDRLLHHLDLYRITGQEDLDSTGYRDSIGGRMVLLVEWPEREPSVLPPENLVIRIEYQAFGREVTFIPSGKSYEDLAKRVVDVFRSNRLTRRHADTQTRGSEIGHEGTD